MNDLMKVWHWEVHQELQESLYFYHFRIIPYVRGDVGTQLRDFFKAQRPSGFCFYEIIGGFDILLHAWLQSDCARNFERKLRAAVIGVNNVFRHTVVNFLRSGVWKNVQIDRKVLRRLSEDQIRRIQAGKDSDLARQLHDAGILMEVRKETKLINFFVCISPPEFRSDRTQEELLRRTIDLCDRYDKENVLVEPWVYQTHGEQWAIISAKTGNYFVIGQFLGELAAILQPFGSINTTFLATGDLLEENGDISEPTLHRARGRDLAVARLLPELYDPNVPDKLQNKVRDWVREVLIPAGLGEEDEKIVIQCLAGVAKQQEKEIRRGLFDFFTDLESYLKARWARFVTTLLGPKKQREMLQLAGVERDLDPKFLGLSHLFTIFGTCIGRSDEIRDKSILSNWQEVVNLRNKVMHGEEERFDPLATWEEDLRLLVEFMRRYQQLREVVERVFGGR